MTGETTAPTATGFRTWRCSDPNCKYVHFTWYDDSGRAICHPAVSYEAILEIAEGILDKEAQERSPSSLVN
jgi:hypothetical protein